MRCTTCNRRLAECSCKPRTLKGRWPTGTWLQKRLQKLRIENALREKQGGSYAIH
jgi:hypothetical protein